MHIFQRHIAVFLLAAAMSAHAQVQQVVLVQNSGWMEPFYADPNSRFKPLVQQLLQRLGARPTVLLAFNEATSGHESPRLLGKSTGAQLTGPVAALELQRKGAGPALADANLHEAVQQAVVKHANAKPAVLWLVTNNRNSPGNDPRTLERNREFYEFLHGSEHITRIVAFPLAMPVKGRLYEARGLIIYGIAYGADSAAVLDEIVSGPLKEIFSDPPLRLKPQSADAIRLVDLRPAGQSGVRVWRNQGGPIHIEFEASRNPGVARLLANVRNDFDAYTIATARIGAEFISQSRRAPVTVSFSPPELRQLQPQSTSEPLTIEFKVPPVPSLWSPEVMFGRGWSVPGQLIVTLDGQKLDLASAARARLDRLFPGDPLPELFRPNQAVSASVTREPVIISVIYPVGPLMAVLGAGALVLGVLGFVSFLIFRARTVEVFIDGDLRKIRLSAFETRTFGEAGSIRRTLFGINTHPAEKHSLSIRR